MYDSGPQERVQVWLPVETYRWLQARARDERKQPAQVAKDIIIRRAKRG